MIDRVFSYDPKCSASGCGKPAVYKIAAPWSDGASRELKNYGLACVEHRDMLLARASRSREGLSLAEGETVGPVGLYRIIRGATDSQLPKEPSGVQKAAVPVG
jgi:hypothetical protein